MSSNLGPCYICICRLTVKFKTKNNLGSSRLGNPYEREILELSTTATNSTWRSEDKSSSTTTTTSTTTTLLGIDFTDEGDTTSTTTTTIPEEDQFCEGLILEEGDVCEGPLTEDEGNDFFEWDEFDEDIYLTLPNTGLLGPHGLSCRPMTQNIPV